eukprot:scaffold55002_cov22-Tisochrysis_lutea.AAC.1
MERQGFSPEHEGLKFEMLACFILEVLCLTFLTISKVCVPSTPLNALLGQLVEDAVKEVEEDLVRQAGRAENGAPVQDGLADSLINHDAIAKVMLASLGCKITESYRTFQLDCANNGSTHASFMLPLICVALSLSQAHQVVSYLGQLDGLWVRPKVLREQLGSQLPEGGCGA